MMKKKKKDGAATPSSRTAPPRRTGGQGLRRHRAPGLQQVRNHVLLQRDMPEAPLEGGRAQGHCVAKEERSASGARRRPRRKDSSPGSSGGGVGSAKAKEKEKTRDKDNECAICLEDLDDPEFGPAQTLDCTHRFHKACVEELRARGVQQACPMCRAKLPDSAEKMFDDGATVYFLIIGACYRVMVERGVRVVGSSDRWTRWCGCGKGRRSRG